MDRGEEEGEPYVLVLLRRRHRNHLTCYSSDHCRMGELGS